MKNILVIVGHRGIGDLIYHLPLLRSLHQTYKKKIVLISNKINKAKDVYRYEKFYSEILEFDHNRYSFIKSINKILTFKNLINSFNPSLTILTSNASRLAIPVHFSNSKKKIIFDKLLGNSHEDEFQTLKIAPYHFATKPDEYGFENIWLYYHSKEEIGYSNDTFRELSEALMTSIKAIDPDNKIYQGYSNGDFDTRMYYVQNEGDFGMWEVTPNGDVVWKYESNANSWRAYGYDIESSALQFLPL